MKRPLILVTNDDGITAPGIRALVEIVQEIGEVLIVAPDSPQSAKGHAITISDPIRLKESDVFEGMEAYECSGTPVDCVKLAKSVILNGRKADLCVSGINHGSNASINILYSGTMSAAMEASLEGIPSIGFSLLDFSWKADFEAAKSYLKAIILQVLENGMKNTKLLNVNIPKLTEQEIKGIKVCRQSKSNWKEAYKETTDPRGQKYYWLTGEFEESDLGEDTDTWALAQGYISIVPSGHDLTSYEAIPTLQPLEEITI